MGQYFYRKPKVLGSLIESVVQELDMVDEYNFHQMENIWNKIVGSAISRSAKPKKIKDSKLVIETKSSTWRAELLLRKENLISQLNNECGKTLIRDLIIY